MRTTRRVVPVGLGGQLVEQSTKLSPSSTLKTAHLHREPLGAVEVGRSIGVLAIARVRGVASLLNAAAAVSLAEQDTVEPQASKGQWWRP